MNGLGREMDTPNQTSSSPAALEWAATGDETCAGAAIMTLTQRGIVGLVDTPFASDRARVLSILEESLAAKIGIKEALEMANTRFRTVNGLGGSATILLVREKKAQFFQVGNVELYHLRGDIVRRVTRDHTVAGQLLALKMISSAEALNHSGRRTLARYLGRDPVLVVDQDDIDLLPGDVLVLCRTELGEKIDLQRWRALSKATHLKEALKNTIGADPSGKAHVTVACRIPRAIGPVVVESNQQKVLEQLLYSESPQQDLERTLIPALESISKATHARRVLLFAADENNSELIAHVGADLTNADRDRWATKIEQLGTGQVTDYLLTSGFEILRSLTDNLLLGLELPTGSRVLEEHLAPLTANAQWFGTLATMATLRSERKRMAERFGVLQDLGRAVGSSLDIDRVLHILLEKTLSITRADLAFVIIPRDGELEARCGMDRAGNSVSELRISKTIVRRVLDTGKSVYIVDTSGDSTDQTASVLALDIMSVMCVPLLVSNRVIGILYVSSNLTARTFSKADLALLEAIGAQTALSIQNAIHVSELEEKRKMAAELARVGQELEIATRIQTALVPQDPHLEGFDIALDLKVATEVGGVLIDYLPLTDGRFWLAIGDVTGHGLTPGLVMMMAQSLFAGLAQNQPDLLPEQLINAINRTLHHNAHHRLNTDHYMTLTVLKHTGDGNFVGAGMHCEALLYRAATGEVEILDTGGFWTGLVPDVSDQTTAYQFKMEPNDVLVLYTDGIIEARNDSGEQFDLKRLIDTVARYGRLPVSLLKRAIFDDVQAWMHQQLDDMSVIILRRSPTEEKRGNLHG